jgi:lysophospholipase L1-like esterase
MRSPIASSLALILLSSCALVPAEAMASLSNASASASGPDQLWTAAWSAAPDSAGPPLQAQTVRQVVQTSIGGLAARLRVSNLLGSGPLTIGSIHVAVHASGSAIVEGTDHVVTFAGKPSVTLAKGAEALSDPVALPVQALQELAISMYLPAHASHAATGPEAADAAATSASTVHGDGQQTAFITPGDATAATQFTDGDVASSRFFLTDVEVSTRSARSIVMFGDSVTDGFGSTQDSNSRLPDALATRLQADPAFASIAVVDSGIAGNRLLNDGPIGQSMLARFDRDALDKAGVHWIVLLAGINDIGVAGSPDSPKDDVSAQQIIDGMHTLVARAHAKGVRIFGATITPNGGYDWPFHSATGEQKRQAVNAWIRSDDGFDAIVDFDRIVRDPVRPDRLLPAFDSGDHMHPNDAGYKAMAAAIDLRRFGVDQ